VAHPSLILPRGGKCLSCKKYTLWGNVIRGIYRRKAAEEPLAYSSEEEDGLDPDPVNLPSSPRKKARTRNGPVAEAERRKATAKGMSSVIGAMEELSLQTRPKQQKRDKAGSSKKKPVIKRTTGRSPLKTSSTDEEEGEFFDLDAISASSESDDLALKSGKGALPRKPKKGKADILPRRKAINTGGSPPPTQFTSQGTGLSTTNLTMDEVVALAMRRVAPPRREAINVDTSSPPTVSTSQGTGPSPTNLTTDEVIAMAMRRVARVEEYETFDISGVSASSESVSSGVKAKRPASGRRPKYIEISD